MRKVPDLTQGLQETAQVQKKDANLGHFLLDAVAMGQMPRICRREMNCRELKAREKTCAWCGMAPEEPCSSEILQSPINLLSKTCMYAQAITNHATPDISAYLYATHCYLVRPSYAPDRIRKARKHSDRHQGSRTGKFFTKWGVFPQAKPRSMG